MNMMGTLQFEHRSLALRLCARGSIVNQQHDAGDGISPPGAAAGRHKSAIVLPLDQVSEDYLKGLRNRRIMYKISSSRMY